MSTDRHTRRLPLSPQACAGFKAAALILGVLAFSALPITLLCITKWAVPIIASIAAVIVLGLRVIFPKQTGSSCPRCMFFVASGLALLSVTASVIVTHDQFVPLRDGNMLGYNLVQAVFDSMFADLLLGTAAMVTYVAVRSALELFRLVQAMFLPKCEADFRKATKADHVT